MGALAWRGGSLLGGEEGDVPREVAEAYAHKLIVLDDLPPPEPVVTDPAPTASQPAKAKPRAKRAKR